MPVHQMLGNEYLREEEQKKEEDTEDFVPMLKTIGKFQLKYRVSQKKWCIAISLHSYRC